MPENAKTSQIQDLREHLFDTLRALKDKNNPMELDRAKAIAEVAQTIVNSAKVEVDFMKVTGEAKGSGFLLPAEEVQPGRTVHRIK